MAISNPGKRLLALSAAFGLALIGLVIVPGVAQAQEVPNSLLHQGRLLDDEGSPLEGSATLTFTIYTAADAGEVVWQDEVGVELEGGFFTAILGGSANPIDVGVLSQERSFLGVAVNEGAELRPRLELHSVPFALVAAQAASVREGSITATSLATDFVLSSEQLPDISWERVTEVPADVNTDTLANLTCESGQIIRHDGTSWGCAEEESGMDSVSAGDGLLKSGPEEAPTLSADFGAGAGQVCEGNDPRLSDARAPLAGSEHYIQAGPAVAQDASINISGDAVVGGNIGIGIEEPRAPLDVSGNINSHNIWANTYSVTSNLPDRLRGPDGESLERFQGLVKVTTRGTSFSPVRLYLVSNVPSEDWCSVSEIGVISAGRATGPVVQCSGNYFEVRLLNHSTSFYTVSATFISSTGLL